MVTEYNNMKVIYNIVGVVTTMVAIVAGIISIAGLVQIQECTGIQVLIAIFVDIYLTLIIILLENIDIK